MIRIQFPVQDAAMRQNVLDLASQHPDWTVTEYLEIAGELTSFTDDDLALLRRI